jgi:hypothetical protein
MTAVLLVSGVNTTLSQLLLLLLPAGGSCYQQTSPPPHAITAMGAAAAACVYTGACYVAVSCPKMVPELLLSMLLLLLLLLLLRQSACMTQAHLQVPIWNTTPYREATKPDPLQLGCPKVQHAASTACK